MVIENIKIIVVISISALLTTGFSTLSNIDALVTKEVKKVFNIENYIKEPIIVSSKLNHELPLKITDSNFKKINNNGNLLGYYFTGKAFGKVDYFDYLVIFDTDLAIKKIKILIYREDRGGEIGSKRWLKQFIGKTSQNSLKYDKDIMGISGATISAKSITNQLDKLMKTINILTTKHIL